MEIASKRVCRLLGRAIENMRDTYDDKKLINRRWERTASKQNNGY
jgi:hypothetical protein